MSDRSFGDYTNRNVVKNPLLSTAVTGLSIEDLTQNAVLLPAVPSQETSTRQDEQHGTQMRTLWHSEHDITYFPSGDTKSNQTQQQNTQINTANPINNNNKNTQNDKINEMTTVSKASFKSTDDFDVNEYFARLQGTRYVSAPLNSTVTDQKANLQAEENLEEINLNDSIEPDKGQGSESIQNSLTADIAQNFSQLPNVLPHVANAVFSSFSNMLNLKSREVTPDEAKVQHEVQQRVVNVPLGVPEEPVSVAPPLLREPPMTGTTSNFRIATKKKVYAQVPGLSSGDQHNIQTFNPGSISQNAPSYFIPDADVPIVATDHSKFENAPLGFDAKSSIKDQTGKVYDYNSSLVTDGGDTKNIHEHTLMGAEKTQEKLYLFDPSAFVPISIDGHDANITGQVETGSGSVSTEITSQESKETSNVQFNPSASVPKPTCQTRFDAKIFDKTSNTNTENEGAKDRSYLFNPAAAVDKPTEKAVEVHSSLHSESIIDFGTSMKIPTESSSGLSSQMKPNTIAINQNRQEPSQTYIHNPATEFMPLTPQGSNTVIPPPPMFSNIPRRDSQTTVGKSVLPPSVARRIAANQPIIKPQPKLNMVPQENIFIPTKPTDPETHAQPNFSLFEYTPNNTNMGQGLTRDKSESIKQTQINLQAQTSCANNQQPLIQIPLHSFNQSLNSSNTSGPLVSSSNTMLPVLPTCESLISKESSSWPLATSVPPIAKEASSTEILFSSQPSKTIQPTRPSFSSDTGIKSEQKSLTERYLQTTDISVPLNTEQANIAPPMFFNPATLNQVSNPKEETQSNQDAANKQFPLFMTSALPEPPKEIPEPPKMTGNLNYRLTKKKPQYYSGPIEGVGNISNNVKPVINPTGPSSFQGAVFTPEQNVQSFVHNSATDYSLPRANIVPRQIDLPKQPTGPSLFQGAILTPDQNVQPIAQMLATEYSSSSACEIAPPFDLNKAAATSYQAAATSYATFDVNEPQERKPLVYNDFNTAFDLSRPTTDKYEDTLQESKGFGIIGSLKSKLSSIDINKIQNTVTTFFDPAYNNTKCEGKKHESLSQDENLSIGNHQKYPQLESPDLGVFISNVQAQKNPTPYNYNSDYSQPAIQPQDHKIQEYFNQLQNYSYPRWSDVYEKPNAYSDYAIITQGRNHNETKPSIEAEKLCTDTALFTHIRKTASENENENVVNISKITDPLPPDALVHQELNRNQKQILSNTRFKDNTEEISDLSENKKKSEISQNTGESSCNSFFERDFKQEQQSSFDDPFTNAFDLGELKTTSSLVEKLPRETSRVVSNISAKDFFDRQHSKEALITNKTDIGFELLQKSTNPVLNFSDNNAISNNKGSQNIFSTQSTADVDTSKELLTTVILPVLKDVSEDLVPPQYLDVNTNDQNASSNFENLIDAGSKALNISQPANTLLNFCKINTMADCASYKDIKNIEEKMENVTLTENNENILKHKSSVSDNFEKSGTIDFKEDFLNEQVSELNICETCREVNKPEEKDADDLTTQLIENITAPIQLANPVEYAFVGSSLVSDKSEISHITEGIIETMKLPPPVELIDDISVSTNINYGWSTNETHSSKVVQDHGYCHQLLLLSSHPGFCQDKTLIFENIPTNASDEIKAEYRFPQEDASILPPPINIPTAPPEEDTKSDESGLDVHSIEQDAKKDFPIYEDFVIEPSETDDDKIEYKERERSSDDPIPDADTFTNRVERYKKMETNPETCELLFGSKEDSLPFELPTSTSPALTIASYFDTGNYAVENHYRNSLTFPSTLSSFTVNASMCIPPGFEDEYKRRLSDIAASRIIPALDENNTFIPDTSTNTPTTVTLTVKPNLTYVPDTSTQTRSIAQLTYSQSPVESLNISDAEVKTMIEKIVEDSSSPALPESELSSFVESKKETCEQNKPDTSSTEKEPQKVEEPKSQSLPDPINFFSSNAESTDDSDVYNNFTRLSSYFASPPKPDHTKSFFELSQSQDHYRHKPKNDTFDSIQNNVKSFFETKSVNTNTNSSSVDVNNKNTNIPQINITNMNLVHDLTSYKNFTPNEDVVKTVNYFTVKYDVEHAKESNIGEPKVSAHLGEKRLVENTNKKYTKEHKNNQLGDVDSLNFEDIINQCKYCCDTTKKFTKLDVNSVDFDNFNVRRAMDRNADTRKEGDSNMAQGKDSVTKKSMSVNFLDQTFQDDSSDKIVSVTEHRTCSDYAPVKYHWFYQIELEDKTMWRGFSAGDSKALEDAYNSPDLKEDTVVATDGGRYDVNVMRRTRTAVYWTDKPTNVMRCSWFYKSTAVPRYVPYTETIAEKLEDMYRHSVTTGEWHRRLMLPNDEMVVMHGPSVMVHFLQASTDGFTATPLFTFGKSVYRSPPKINVSEDQPLKIDHLVLMVHGAGEWRHQKQKIQSMRQRVVRGCVESEIEDTEPSSIDHLLLMCHGVGSACDMRFRSVEEVVDDFRSASLQLVQSHYRNSYDSGLVGRVEVLPISWHSSLHSGENGVDTRLAAVTLDSIPRLRNFTNDTLLDVLFYTSPVFCQTIIDTVCSELNRIYALFKRRNPDYEGGVSLGGHSLGSVILYDLLCHQVPKDTARPVCTDKQYVTGTAGTGQPSVRYPRLSFQPDALYALGSPIAIFECIRGVQTLGRDFCLPTCKNFFNIFHPYDPIAYRIEPMINPQLRDVKPSLIPHHKGRKRMHLELKDTMARVGADIKQKVIESIKSTWSSMWRTQPPPDTQLEKVVEEEIEKEALNSESKDDQVEEHEVTAEMLGKLNGGRRVDHVLQEAPFEMINEYLFAMSSHVCYWESEDTMLVMLREIYNAIGVTPDCCVPQRTMTVQRTRPQEEPDTLASPESPSTSRG